MAKLYEIKGEPTVNAVSKEAFQKRTEEVFKVLGNVLGKSFGPFGAPTIISNMANSTFTKDGYTISKNLVMDTQDGGDPVDKVIYDLIDTVCGRVNYEVGDATTTVILLTIAMYQAYRDAIARKDFDEKKYPPREIIRVLKNISTEAVKRLQEKATSIRDLDKEDRVKKIRDIVSISSNGDEEITNALTKFYSAIDDPTISCEFSPDGQTHINIVEGYRADMSILDGIWVNTDDGYCAVENADVLIFDHKFGRKHYEKIVQPLAEACRMHERRLVVIAPFYDQNTLFTLIRADAVAEINKKKQPTIVPIILRAATPETKKMLGDLAILLNTELMDTHRVSDIITATEEYPITKILDISARGIPGIKIAVKIGDEPDEETVTQVTDDGVTKYEVPLLKNALHVGFIDMFTANTQDAVFSGFHYNEQLYKLAVNEAYTELDTVLERYKSLGTYTRDVAIAQRRYNSLCLRMGSIEVGGSSGLSQKMKKDAYDDSIRAAESAYKYGYIMGGNVDSISILEDMYHEMLAKEEYSELDKQVLFFIYDGLRRVNEMVLQNGYGDDSISLSLADVISNDIPDVELSAQIAERLEKYIGATHSIIDPAIVEELIPVVLNRNGLRKYVEDRECKLDDDKKKLTGDEKVELPVSRWLSAISITLGSPFDMIEKEFSNHIITSANSDIQVLIAVVDLMTILLGGNQLVLTSKNNFEHQ